MNFFEHQDQAHRESKKFLFLFLLAVDRHRGRGEFHVGAGLWIWTERRWPFGGRARLSQGLFPHDFHQHVSLLIGWREFV